MDLDQWDWLPRPVFYVVASGVAAWMVVGRLAEGKGHVADLLAPLTRRRREQIEQREQAAREQRQRELREVLTARGEESPDYQEMVRRIEALNRAVKRLERIEEENTAQRDMSAGYLRYDAGYHFRAGVLAAEANFELPEHRSYSEWCRDYLQARGQPADRRWTDDKEG